jgi:hypothetical protein
LVNVARDRADGSTKVLDYGQISHDVDIDFCVLLNADRHMNPIYAFFSSYDPHGPPTPGFYCRSKSKR